MIVLPNFSCSSVGTPGEISQPAPDQQQQTFAVLGPMGMSIITVGAGQTAVTANNVIVTD
jgi:hypothetical protein